MGLFLHAVAPEWDFLAVLPFPVCFVTLAIAIRGWLRLARKQVTLAKTLDVSRGRGPLIKFVNQRPILGTASRCCRSSGGSIPRGVTPVASILARANGVPFLTDCSGGAHVNTC